MSRRLVVTPLALAATLLLCACGDEGSGLDGEGLGGDDALADPEPSDRDGEPRVDGDPGGEADPDGDDAASDADGDVDPATDADGDEGADADLGDGDPGYCGDSTTDPGETCDDGNAVDGDGCDTNCTSTACGNGILTGSEECDDGNPVDGDGCDTNCTSTACGNGILTGGEACDDGNPVEGDGCDTNCTYTACGNGVVTAGEQCDDGNDDGADACSTSCEDRVAPHFTSTDNAALWSGQPANLVIITTGAPASTITLSGDPLPATLVFTDHGDGTAQITGTPASADIGSYALAFTATNGVEPDATQPFSLLITSPPALALVASTAQTVSVGADTSITFSIGNTGGAGLVYEVVTDGDGAATIHDSPRGAVFSGFRSTIYTNPATAGSNAQFSADDFVLEAETVVLSLRAEGFVVSGAALATASPLLTWSIYPDASGVPAGNPSSAPSAASWTYTASATAAGVSAIDGTIALDLVAAGEAPTLPAGRYWLVTNTTSTFTNRWAHFGSNTGSGGFASLTVSTANTGAWAANYSLAGLAMSVRGRVACGAPWIGTSVAPSGTVSSAEAALVVTTLTTTGLSPGTYHAALCVVSNDPARPREAIRVELTVNP